MNLPDNFVITLGDVFDIVGEVIALILFIICLLILLVFKILTWRKRRKWRRGEDKGKAKRRSK